MPAAPIPVSSRWGSPGRSSNYVGDERVLKLGLSVVLGSGGRLFDGSRPKGEVRSEVIADGKLRLAP
jgi:hypothetical protein